MALQIAYITPEGFECSEAYVVIVEAADRKDQPAAARYVVYKDHAAQLAGRAPVGQFDFSFAYNTEGDPIRVQAYAALKQRPEMTGAADV